MKHRRLWDVQFELGLATVRVYEQGPSDNKAIINAARRELYGQLVEPENLKLASIHEVKVPRMGVR